MATALTPRAFAPALRSSLILLLLLTSIPWQWPTRRTGNCHYNLVCPLAALAARWAGRNPARSSLVHDRLLVGWVLHLQGQSRQGPTNVHRAALYACTGRSEYRVVT